MKKTIACLLISFLFLAAVSACSTESDEPQTSSETVAAINKEGFPVISNDERGLFFRYYYISVWNSVCSNVKNDGFQFGYGDNFDPDVSPAEQHFLKEKDGTPILWSDEFAALAVKDFNRVITLYNDAAKDADFELDGNDFRSINDNLEHARGAASEKDLSFADYLSDYYGDEFTPTFFEKLLTVGQISSSYKKELQKSFMDKRSKDTSVYEEYSRLADGDYQDYIDKLLSESSDVLDVGDACCVEGKAAAIAGIEKKISAD